MFLAMERTYLDAAGDRACVFRCGDIFGAGDPPIEAKVGDGAPVPRRLGAVQRRRAVLPRSRVEDAADAIVHALEHRITGLHNLTHAEVPPTNASLFDAISAAQDLPALVYRDEIASPKSPISVAKLAATGFTASRSYDACGIHRRPVGLSSTRSARQEGPAR